MMRSAGSRGGVPGRVADAIRTEGGIGASATHGWASNAAAEERYESWIEAMIAFYGDIKPSMLQDLERGRKTEVDFINGYVVTLGHASGVPVHMNATITGLVHQIERGDLQPTPDRMNDLAAQTDWGEK